MSVKNIILSIRIITSVEKEYYFWRKKVNEGFEYNSGMKLEQ